ncbi:MAG TPA: hypothetical protein H9669_07185 [Firmicutes bacterium]|nr:hypothetical protein [Bacillota bacterium]
MKRHPGAAAKHRRRHTVIVRKRTFVKKGGTAAMSRPLLAGVLLFSDEPNQKGAIR